MNIHHEFLDLLEAVPRLVKQMHGNTWAKKRKTHGGPKVKKQQGPKAGKTWLAHVFFDFYPCCSVGFDPTMFSAF